MIKLVFLPVAIVSIVWYGVTTMKNYIVKNKDKFRWKNRKG